MNFSRSKSEELQIAVAIKALQSVTQFHQLDRFDVMKATTAKTS